MYFTTHFPISIPKIKKVFLVVRTSTNLIVSRTENPPIEVSIKKSLKIILLWTIIIDILKKIKDSSQMFCAEILRTPLVHIFSRF